MNLVELLGDSAVRFESVEEVPAEFMVLDVDGCLPVPRGHLTPPSAPVAAAATSAGEVASSRDLAGGELRGLMTGRRPLSGAHEMPRRGGIVGACSPALRESSRSLPSTKPGNLQRQTVLHAFVALGTQTGLSSPLGSARSCMAE